MKVLILGCGGFIGSHLVDKLIKRGGYEITGYDTSVYKIAEHLPHFTFIQKDIYDDMAELTRHIAKTDVVIFLASICNPSIYMKKPLSTINSNFTRPQKIVDMATIYQKWFIQFSTCEVYGRTISSYVGDGYRDLHLYMQLEDKTPSVLGPIHNTRWTYATAKMLMDRYLYACRLEHGLPYTIIRPYNFFGSRMDYLPEVDGVGVPRILASFMDSLIYNKPMKLVDGGNQLRTITYIDDAMEAVLTILENRSRAEGEIFNIANPENEVSVRELALIMRQVFGDFMEMPEYYNHPIEDIPAMEFYGAGYEDCDRRVPGVGKIRSLGWEPKFGKYDTIYHTVKSFLQFYKEVMFKKFNKVIK